MAQKQITDLTLRSNADDTINVPVQDATQTYRVTGAQLKSYLRAANTAPTYQTFTSGTGTYTLPAGVISITVELIGGGGGGGGCQATSTGQTASGAGGGAGSYLFKRINAPSATYAYAVGAAGTQTVGGNGGNGGTTTFGTSFLSAAGGSGGNYCLAQNSTSLGVSGGAGGTATGGDLNIKGSVGGHSILFGAYAQSLAGMGAAAPGGLSCTVQTNPGVGSGANATAYGGGGSGGSIGASIGAVAGGVGFAGVIFITEYYQ